MVASKSTRTLLNGISTVLFDVDGTLVDSNHYHAEAWVKALVSFGHTVSTKELLPWIGKGGDKILSGLIGIKEESPEGKAIGELRSKLFLDDYVSRVRAFPAAALLVELLKSQGFTVAIATSAKTEELNAILEVSGLTGIFPHATSSDDAENSKPDPDIIEAALKKLAVTANDAVMIGDTPYDIEASLRAGVRCLAVRSGGWDSQSLKGASHIFADVEHLYKVLAEAIS